MQTKILWKQWLDVVPSWNRDDPHWNTILQNFPGTGWMTLPCTKCQSDHEYFSWLRGSIVPHFPIVAGQNVCPQPDNSPAYMHSLTRLPSPAPLYLLIVCAYMGIPNLWRSQTLTLISSNSSMISSLVPPSAAMTSSTSLSPIPAMTLDRCFTNSTNIFYPVG